VSDWHVIVVEGGMGAVRDVVAAVLADRRPDPASVVFGDEVGLEHESLAERLRALLKGGHHALLVPAGLAAELIEALAQAGGAVGLRLAGRHAVAGASFAVEAEVYSREVAADIRAALQAVPEGVRVERDSEREEVRAEYAGVELYAPVHDYVYGVAARVAGAPAGVLAVRRRLAGIEAVRVSPLHLVGAPAPTAG